MRNIPKVYLGTEVTEEVIQKIKIICKTRYDDITYQEYFSNIQNMEDLCELHDTVPSEETIIMGEDWFIAYADKGYQIEVLEWVALNDIEEKTKQIREVLKTLKDILYQARKTCISAFLRHDTSYKFYKLGVKKGLIKPAIDELLIDCYHPTEMDEIINELLEKYQTLANFFNSEQKDNYPQYEQYVLHNVAFTITDDFVKKYEKSQKRK